MTPHISATKGGIAKLSVLSGDSLRTKRVAEKQAACVLTVSGTIGEHRKMTSEERVTCLENMISVALGGCCN
ncbi:hypothetical protein [Candidatus Mycoplasma haematohominis]|uniref:Purine nucleoside phosphorylase n=1 Tax=Candidatus Mycoplasma haematohominis TaxID=1494318 RepID=A0A478FS31_9MOLU|nr:hypothetical protein [Candidatus Mycoplasma haemohominis]GCE63176.1 purine nucleoside phosphorylase [Candidatus Mycoplasma haemohominis]